MTKFREGDVIQNSLGEEGKITDVFDDCVRYATYRGHLYSAQDTVALLRRPARVGDWLHDLHGFKFCVEESHIRAAERGTFAEDLAFFFHDGGTPVDTTVFGKPLTIAGKVNTFTVDCHIKSGGIKPLEIIADEQQPSRFSPPEENFSRALFDTDPEVLAFVRKHADATVTKSHSTTTRLRYEGAPDVIMCRSEHVDDSRLQRALDIAWQRNELGLRTHWERRVREALAKTGGSK